MRDYAIIPDMTTTLAFNDETYAIRGAIFAVYKALGPGFLEEVYQKALEAEFRHCGIPFEAQKELHVMYRGVLRRRAHDVAELLRRRHRRKVGDADGGTL